MLVSTQEVAETNENKGVPHFVSREKVDIINEFYLCIAFKKMFWKILALAKICRCKDQIVAGWLSPKGDVLP